MALILCIETSTTICSVALEKDGLIIASEENNEGMNHSRLTAPFADKVLKKAGLSCKDLDAVAVSMGPGSYTGLRIGVSVAKGICYGANIPLISVPTLAALADNGIERVKASDAFYVPMIDARRMEVYSSVFSGSGEMVSPTEAVVLTEDFCKPFLDQGRVYFFGNGSGKAKDIITHRNASFLDDINTTALYMARTAEEKFKRSKFEDVSYFEPFYLKDFITTKAKKRL